MVSEKMTIEIKLGIHARIAAYLTAACKECSSNMTFLVLGKSVNPKNVMELMGARIGFGQEITIQCEGPAEVEDLKTVIYAIKNLEHME